MKKISASPIVLLIALLTVSLGLAEPTAKATFNIEGMTCGACVGAVKMRLKQTVGVLSYEVSLEKHEADVTFDSAKTDAARIAEAITKSGFPATATPPATEANQAATPDSNTPPAEPKTRQAVQRADIPGERVTFYEVGLVCTAAPKIGCGSRAKPALRALEADEAVTGAWLNEAGTSIAVGWNDEPLPKKNLDAILGRQGLAINEVRGESRTELIASFHRSEGWYDSATVNQLSEREAGVIASRFVRRISAKTRLTRGQESGLKTAFEQTIRRALTSDTAIDFEALGKELLDVAVPNVRTADVEVVRQVIADGYWPLANEE